MPNTLQLARPQIQHRQDLSRDKLRALTSQLARVNVEPELNINSKVPSINLHGCVVQYHVNRRTYQVWRDRAVVLELQGSPRNVARDISDWLYTGGDVGQARSLGAGPSTIFED